MQSASNLMTLGSASSASIHTYGAKPPTTKAPSAKPNSTGFLSHQASSKSLKSQHQNSHHNNNNNQNYKTINYSSNVTNSILMQQQYDSNHSQFLQLNSARKHQ
jgi:hypothetical protein